MNQILVDTSALIAFFFRANKNHETAQAYIAQFPHKQWVILSPILAETVTWIRAKASVRQSIAIGALLRQEHQYLPLTKADDALTWEMFRRYDDKLWSYADCAVLALSQQLGIHEVFAFDDHFRQMAGPGVHCVPGL